MWEILTYSVLKNKMNEYCLINFCFFFGKIIMKKKAPSLPARSLQYSIFHHFFSCCDGYLHV